MAGDERLVGRVRDGELEAETLGVVEPETPLLSGGGEAVIAEPRRPEVERALRPDAERHQVHHPIPGAAAARARVLEERDIRARTALLVGVEQVVDRRVVLVDRLLHEPQSEHARVEGDVPGRVARDARHVMDSLELHRLPDSRAIRPQTKT